MHPKRFPAAYSVDWRQRVLADRPEYVVVDKPTGVQVCAPASPPYMLQAVSKRHTKTLLSFKTLAPTTHLPPTQCCIAFLPMKVRGAHTAYLPCLCRRAPCLARQVVPTVDNMLESVVALTAAALALPPDALLTPHRLDVGTSGIVLLAKNPGFACWFSTLLKNKPDAVVKTYRCLSAAPPPCGPMVHWAVMKQRAAGEPAHTRMLLECAVPDAYSSSGSGSNCGGDGCCRDANVTQCPPVEGAVRCELIVEKVSSLWVSCCRKRRHSLPHMAAAVGLVACSLCCAAGCLRLSGTIHTSTLRLLGSNVCGQVHCCACE